MAFSTDFQDNFYTGPQKVFKAADDWMAKIAPLTRYENLYGDFVPSYNYVGNMTSSFTPSLPLSAPISGGIASNADFTPYNINAIAPEQKPDYLSLGVGAAGMIAQFLASKQMSDMQSKTIYQNYAMQSQMLEMEKYKSNQKSMQDTMSMMMNMFVMQKMMESMNTV